MTSGRYEDVRQPDDELQSDGMLMGLLRWPTSFLVGLGTFILGIIVAVYPKLSLSVVAVLLGVLLIFSGIFQIVEAFDSSEHSRVWRGISGVLFILAGIVLIRHLHLSVALIGLVIGLTWVVQGLSALIGGISGSRAGLGTWWLTAFGLISLIAGIVVISSPIASVTTLAVLMGIWFAVMGVFEMVGAVIARRARGKGGETGAAGAGREGGAGQASVPGQRATETDSTAASRKASG